MPSGLTASGIAGTLFATMTWEGDIMRHTLNAVFEQRSDAQHVLEELLASGYLSADTSDYADSSSRECHVVTLTAESEPEAERAVGIIQRFGPLGIEDLHDEPDQAKADTDTPSVSAGAGETRRRYMPGTEPGALQNRAHEDSRYFGTQGAASPPTGNTYEEIMGASPELANPYEGRTAARTSGAADTGIHDDDQAQAYLHGADAARDSNYGNHHWKDVEARLKREWERRHAGGGPSTWDKVKAAVRHGWDRVKS
jgi:hypothetical protein